MVELATGENAMSRLFLVTALWLCATCAQAQMLGFGAQGAAQQREIEAKFDATLNPDELRAWLKQLSSAPNHVGAPHNKANAEFIRDQLKSFGWDARIESFEVLYPTLKQHRLEMVAPKSF